jgi:BA14K-like protein
MTENHMRAKLLTSAAALALTACTVLATAGPASAAPWGWHHGWHGGWGLGGLAAGVIGGAVAAATSPLWAPGYYGYGPAYPVYDYTPPAPVVVGGGGLGWCEAHFRSYNPATGMYLGYDGLYHRCG